MNKKIKILILIVLIILAAWAFLRFVVGGPEDDWICVDGEWVKHGDPSIAKPSELCPGAEKAGTAAINLPYYKIYFSNNKLDPEISCLKVFPISKSAGDGPSAQAGELSLRGIIEVLLQGPSEKDKENGYFTSIPDNVKIKSVKKEGNTVKIDFSKDIEKGVGGSCRVTAIRAQIYWTIINFDKSVRSVIISVEGNTEALQP